MFDFQFKKCIQTYSKERSTPRFQAFPTELRQAIWALNAEGEKYVTAGLIMKRFPALNRLKLTTVLTLITRLQMKDFISVNKEGRSNCYTPIIPLEEYRKFALEDFIERVFTGDREALVSMLQKAE